MKKYLLGFLALTVAIAMSAFTAPSTTTMSWFRLIPGQNPNLAASYELDEGPVCEGGADEICGVYGTLDPNTTDKPDFSQPHPPTYRP